MNKLIDYLQIALIAVHTAFSATLGTVLLPLGQNKALYYASQVWSTLLMLTCGVTLEIHGEENLDTSEARIYVSNHQSNFDIPILFKALPVGLFFISKIELKKIPFMGWYMWLVGMIFIDRKHPEKAKKSLIEAGEQIKRGKNILSFPEGTRSKTGKMGMFKRGSFVLASQAGVTVVPIAILGTEKAIPTGKFEIHSTHVKVNIGKPIDPKQFGPKGVDQFAAYTRDQVAVLHQELLEMA